MIGLPDLAGMGMRKAFEYLVKEHAVGFYGRARDDVAKEPLGQTVNKIDDTDLLRWATAAKNLGNDEVHWEKKHVDKGAVELDKLIVVVAKAFASKIADRALLNEIEATEAAHKQPHNP